MRGKTNMRVALVPSDSAVDSVPSNNNAKPTCCASSSSVDPSPNNASGMRGKTNVRVALVPIDSAVDPVPSNNNAKPTGCASSSSVDPSPNNASGMRGKTNIRVALVPSDSAVDPVPSNNDAKPTGCASSSSVDPSPNNARLSDKPSHRHERRLGLLSTISALENRIHSKTFSSKNMIFPLAKKEGGDVDFGISTKNQSKRREDGVDPSPPLFTENTSLSKHEGVNVGRQARTKSSDVDGNEDDGVPDPTRKLITSLNTCLPSAEPVVYDFEGSHCVDGEIGAGANFFRRTMHPYGEPVESSVDPVRPTSPSGKQSGSVDPISPKLSSGKMCDYVHPLGFERSPGELSDSVDLVRFKFPSGGQSSSVDPVRRKPSSGKQLDRVDPIQRKHDLSKYRKKAYTVDAKYSTRTPFCGLMDGFSSPVDDREIKKAPRDWQPHEAKAILSDHINSDLGEECICMEENGCICFLDECRQRLDQDVAMALTQSAEMNPKAEEDSPRRSSPPEQCAPLPDQSRREGINIDPRSSDTDQKKVGLQRRKNNKLSERVICNRGLSSENCGTEVEPKDGAAQATVRTTSHLSKLSSDCAKDTLDISPITSNDICCEKGAETEVALDILHSEKDSASVSDPADTELAVNETQLLLDCIAAADHSISTADTAEADAFEKLSGAEAQLPVQWQAEVSEDGFICQTEVQTKLSPDTLVMIKKEVLAVRNDSESDQNVHSDKDKFSSAAPSPGTSNDFALVADDDNMSPETHDKPGSKTISQANCAGKEETQTSSPDVMASTSNTMLLTEKPTSKVVISRIPKPLRRTSPEKKPAQEKEITVEAPKISEEHKNVFADTSERKRGEDNISADGKRSKEGHTTPEEIKGRGREKKEASPEAELGTKEKRKIVNTQHPRSRSPSTFSNRNERFGIRSCTEACDSNNRHKPASAENKSDQADKDANHVPDSPAVGSEQKHEHVVATIPPPYPRSRTTYRKAPRSDPPGWNSSVAVEKPPNPYTRPQPLVSKRNRSALSLAGVSRESSKQSLSPAVTTESAEGLLQSSMSESAHAGRSVSECNNFPQRSLSQKMNKVGTSSAAKQPFIPVGSTNNNYRKDIPASNTARSHPDLRVPGKRVDLPVVYPCAISSMSKRTDSSDQDSTAFGNSKPGTELDSRYMKSQKLLLDFNENSSASVDAARWDGAQVPIFAAFEPCLPWSVRKMMLIKKNKSTKIEPKDLKSPTIPVKQGKNMPQVYGNQETSRAGPISKLPAACLKHQTRKLGDVKSPGLKLKPFAVNFKQLMVPSTLAHPIPVPQKESRQGRARSALKVPVQNFVTTLEEVLDSQSPARLRQQKIQNRNVAATQRVASAPPALQSAAKALQKSPVLLKCDFTYLFSQVAFPDAWPENVKHH